MGPGTTAQAFSSVGSTKTGASAAARARPARSTTVSSGSNQSFRSWMALAQQRGLLGLTGSNNSVSDRGFPSLSMPMGLDMGSCSVCGAGRSDYSNLFGYNGLSTSNTLAGLSTSTVSASMVQAIKAVAREAVTQALREIALQGLLPLTNPAAAAPATGANSPTGIGVPATAPVGTTTPTAPTGENKSVGAMAIGDFPKPPDDNGRGMHWIPTRASSASVVDRFVREAKEMHVKWMVFLNDGTKIGENDYLVKKLVENGIEPVIRVYTDNGKPIEGDLAAMVRHFKALGVSYYQLYNEPNLNVENPDGVPDVEKYLDKWVPAARTVSAAGGLPGFGALSPGGNYDDLEFLKKALDRVKERGEVDALDHAWMGLHNYTLNHPLDYMKDSNGFMKFQWYDQVIREKLGRSMPVISTEGGTHIGVADDRTMAPITEDRQVQMVTEAYRYMQKREPYNFAYTYWIIANEEGGGADPAFSRHALFQPNYTSPLVQALKQLGDK